MANIRTTESESLEICLESRSRLTDRYKVDSIIALRYFSDKHLVCDDENMNDAKAIEHIRKCSKCREWINYAIPKSILQRQHRLTRYCCAGMFVAVEEPEAAKNHIQFELFRGEDPCWKIDGKWSFIAHCPWCGKKLPKEPFCAD